MGIYQAGRYLLTRFKNRRKKVYIGKEIHQLLSGIKREQGNPYVILGAVEKQYLTDLQKPWRHIRKIAELEDLCIHDLRHSYASFALANGATLAEIGKLLGQTQIQTTARYAHLVESVADQAANRTTNAIFSKLEKSNLH